MILGVKPIQDSSLVEPKPNTIEWQAVAISHLFKKNEAWGQTLEVRHGLEAMGFACSLTVWFFGVVAQQPLPAPCHSSVRIYQIHFDGSCCSEEASESWVGDLRLFVVAPRFIWVPLNDHAFGHYSHDAPRRHGEVKAI
jgi:hypothetical protein